jgi:glycerate 2-kinase
MTPFESSPKNSLKILVAPNAFKESMSAMEAAQAIALGIHTILPKAKITTIPIADGGDGTLEAVVAATRGRMLKAKVVNPLGKRILAEYGITGDGKTAIIEMSRASGLALVPPAKRNPMVTTSYGTGQLIQAALGRGVESIILGIGGSATVDGGIGALQALGVAFLDARGRQVGFGGKGLLALEQINLSKLNSRLRQTQILLACDVDNPLVGVKGAAAVFGPQKGATPAMVKKLDAGLGRLARIIQKNMGEDISRIPGAGAAGGIAGSFKGLLKAQLRPGSDLIFDLLNVKKIVPKMDLIITGEGKIDVQTQFGKGPGMLAKIAQRHRIPVIGITGTVSDDIDELFRHGFAAIFSIVNRPMEQEFALRHAPSLLKSAAEQISRLIQMSTCHLFGERIHDPTHGQSNS